MTLRGGYVFMSKRIEFDTHGVCSVKIIVEVEEDIIQKVEFVGGCPGNTMGVSRLCIGRKIDEVIPLLKGINCRGRGTSCPDQLACALMKFKEKEKIYAD